jgi:hypothetical protein
MNATKEETFVLYLVEIEGLTSLSAKLVGVLNFECGAALNPRYIVF